MTTRLRQTAYRVHRRCTQPNHEVTRTNQSKNFLLLNRPMRDRPKDLRVKPCVPRELFGINLIALAIAVRDRSQFSDVGHDDLVS